MRLKESIYLASKIELFFENIFEKEEKIDSLL